MVIIMSIKIVSLKQFGNLLNRMDSTQFYDAVVQNVIHSLNSGNTDPLKALLQHPSIRDQRTIKFKLNENGRILVAYLRFFAKGLVSIKDDAFKLKSDRTEVVLSELPAVMDWYKRPVEDKAPEAVKGSSVLSRVSKFVDSINADGLVLKDAEQANALLAQLEALQKAVAAAVAAEAYQPN